MSDRTPERGVVLVAADIEEPREGQERLLGRESPDGRGEVVVQLEDVRARVDLGRGHDGVQGAVGAHRRPRERERVGGRQAHGVGGRAQGRVPVGAHHAAAVQRHRGLHRLRPRPRRAARQHLGPLHVHTAVAWKQSTLRAC